MKLRIDKRFFISAGIVVILVVAAGAYIFFRPSTPSFEPPEEVRTPGYKAKPQEIWPAAAEPAPPSLTREPKPPIDFSLVKLSDFYPWKVGYEHFLVGIYDVDIAQTVRDVADRDEQRVITLECLSVNNDDAKPFEKKIRISDAEIDDMTTGFTLLRNPLVIGNEWPNVVTVDGKQYQGTTRITHLEGSWVFTETHVPGMDGFGEHTLHRKMVFGVGQGHIYDLEFYMFSELFWADFWISELWEEREYLMGEWWDR